MHLIDLKCGNEIFVPGFRPILKISVVNIESAGQDVIDRTLRPKVGKH